MGGRLYERSGYESCGVLVGDCIYLWGGFTGFGEQADDGDEIVLGDQV